MLKRAKHYCLTPNYLLTMAIAKVGAGGIEYIQGSLKKPKKVNGHNHGNYVIATHRTADTENPNCQRLYVREADAYQRSTQPTPKETAIRTRFTAVRTAVAARKRDLEFIATDQQNFLAQKDLASGKKTMKAYLWKVCGDAYDAEHPRS